MSGVIALYPAPLSAEIPVDINFDRHFITAGVRSVWRAGAGRGIEHICYSLVGCPAVPAANYILTRVDKTGTGRVLCIGRVENTAPSLNLAHLRHLAASLGANQIHIHIPATGRRTRQRIERVMKKAATENTLHCQIT